MDVFSTEEIARAAGVPVTRVDALVSAGQLRPLPHSDDFFGFGEAVSAVRALRAEIAASAAETRRHFDVVAERLMDKIQLVGEGVIGVDQKLARFRGEVAEEFRQVDRRLLGLEARAIG